MSTDEPARRYGGVSGEERRRRRHTKLVEAAIGLLSTGGPAAVTLRAVCERSGLHQRYFYESFLDRDALLAELFDVARHRLAAAMLAARTGLPAKSLPLAHVKAAVAALVDFVAGDEPLGQLLLGETDVVGPATRWRGRLLVAAAEFTANEVARALGPKSAPVEELRATMLMLSGGALDLIAAWRAGDIDLRHDALVDHISTVVIKALLTAPPDHRSE
ncbi:putative transcriptional regulator, TetR family protein [Lentzea pudingi]|uniref:Transcriptional regulator, TetR family protein n=1 Tax=Lentzea pudingi TaxID=1789439 RepID=A0ABQ2HXU0_9PSEU|nr:TetR family transcriptional regulator [Lentzea pudingi]GGM93969.1 putative transcriptional regulator, TetR family protein [Lentzea pudingi]